MCPVGALTAEELSLRDTPLGVEAHGERLRQLRRRLQCAGWTCAWTRRCASIRGRTTSVDDGWLCDRGRWGLDAVNSPERLRTPLIRRKNGSSWFPPPGTRRSALVAATLREIVAARRRARRVGGIGSTHTTNEEAYLFQKLLRAGSARTMWITTMGASRRSGATACRGSGPTRIAGLEKASHIVLLGADTYHRQPVHRPAHPQSDSEGARVYVRLRREPNTTGPAGHRAPFAIAAGQTGAVARALLKS